MDPISALIMGAATLGSAGLSFAGGQMANAQSLANVGPATTASIDAKMAAAQKYGISPLVMLGQQPVNVPASNVFQDAPSLGQNLGRAISAGIAGPPKADQELAFLQKQRLALENASLSENLVAQQLRNSQNAVNLAQPANVTSVGMGPRNRDMTLGRGDLGVPITAPVRTAAGTIYYPTRDASTRSFGSLGEPTSRVTGDALAAANAYMISRQRQQDVRGTFSEGPFELGPITIRPDIARKYLDRLPWED